MKQGDIYLADLNPVRGHEQAGFRPVLIIQNNTLNRNLKTVIIAPITSNLKAKGRATTYFLPKENTKLHKDSVILLFQIRTVDKMRLKRKVSSLSQEDFSRVRKQLEFVF